MAWIGVLPYVEHHNVGKNQPLSLPISSKLSLTDRNQQYFASTYIKINKEHILITEMPQEIIPVLFNNDEYANSHQVVTFLQDKCLKGDYWY